MADEKLTVDEAKKKIDRGELTPDEALTLLDRGQIVPGKPEQKNPESVPKPKTDAKPESGSESKPEPKKHAAASGKSRTVEDMEQEREAMKADLRKLTAEIEKKKREQKRKAEKAAREQEQRDALEWYRKYRGHIEMAKRLKLKSGMTVFEWIESEIAKENGDQKG